MKIEFNEIPIKDLVEDYRDDGEGGVRGYGGKLDIRPPHQREFVYGPKQRDAVIKTVRQRFPLNIMYWAVRSDDTYEIIDGQQRTISIAQYIRSDFSVDNFFFHNLTRREQTQIKNYKLMIYFCKGSHREKLDWFETINIAGAKLTTQELRNAVYSGSWVSDAKRYFSRSSSPAVIKGGDYLKGRRIRQEHLETVINWISGGNIDRYMGMHQHNNNAEDLWEYFNSVIEWVKRNFTGKRPNLTKMVNWGMLYCNYKEAVLDPVELESKIQRLLLEDEIQRLEGIYPYLLTGDERYLDLRTFSDAQRQRAFERQKHICPKPNGCGEKFLIHQMQADHITPWSDGGRTTDENCQMLCRRCNAQKGAK